LHDGKEFHILSRPVAAGGWNLFTQTRQEKERERQQDMGFPIASMMPQSMEALHWLEGMSLLHNHSTHWLQLAQSRVLSSYNISLFYFFKHMYSQRIIIIIIIIIINITSIDEITNT
jgi:hypothetical protein